MLGCSILVVSFVVIVKFCQHKVSLYSIFCQSCIDLAQTFLKCLHVVNLIALGWWLLTPKSLTVVVAAAVANPHILVFIKFIIPPLFIFILHTFLNKMLSQTCEKFPEPEMSTD